MLTMSPSWMTVESGMPVAHDFHLSDTQQALGKWRYPQRRGVGAVVTHVLVGYFVDFVRGNSRCYRFPRQACRASAAMADVSRIASMTSGVCTKGSPMASCTVSFQTYSGAFNSFGNFTDGGLYTRFKRTASHHLIFLVELVRSTCQ